MFLTTFIKPVYLFGNTMSKRAEQAALDKYPRDIHRNLLDARYPNDINSRPRQAFIEGYEQAEKDLALTWEDIAKIDALILEANNEFAVDYSKEITRKQFYTEVLDRFNKLKEEKK